MKNMVLTFLFILMVFACEDDQSKSLDSQLTVEELKVQMSEIETEIGEITSKKCTVSSSCKTIAIGVKPCGGPTHYIIYGTTTNQNELSRLVSEYNELNEQYNKLTGAFSDCVFLNPPVLECSSGVCVGQ